MLNNFIISFAIISSSLIFFFNKFNILVDQKFEKHKNHSSKNKSILLGGTLILFFMLLLLVCKY